MAIGASRTYRGLADYLASKAHIVVGSGFVPNGRRDVKLESKVAEVKGGDIV